MTKSLIIALLVLFMVLQYKLWFDPDGVINIWRLRHLISQQNQCNATIKAQNTLLKADVKSLKNGQDAIEERARHDLGMIKKDEIFVAIEPSSQGKS